MAKLPLLIPHLAIALFTLMPGGAAADPTVDPDLSKIHSDLQQLNQQAKARFDQLAAIDPVKARGHIETFQHPRNLEEKIKAATELSLTQLSVDFASHDPGTKAKLPFSTLELAILKEARAYIESVQKMVDAFEAGLTPEEIAFITKDNPDSISRRTKRIYLSNARPDCSRQTFNALRKKVELAELQAKGVEVMFLASSYQDEFLKSYFSRVSQLLNERAKFRADRPVLLAYYAQAALVFKEDGSNAYRAKHEKELAKAGVARERIKAYVLEQAELSPECLGHFNIPFTKFLKQDVLMERGNFLLQRVKDQIVKTGTRPQNSYYLPIQEGHPIFGDRHDPYGNLYVVKYAGRAVSLVSPGPDTDIDTADDIIAATIELP